MSYKDKIITIILHIAVSFLNPERKSRVERVDIVENLTNLVDF